MKRFLTTGFLGAILGLLVGAPADASLISRGFLDEALENYATTTALDLKANQSDFTDLSNKIGDAWPYTFSMLPGLQAVSLGWGYPGQTTLQNASDLVWFLFGGAQVGVLNTLAQSVVVTGEYSIDSGQIDDGFRSLSQLTDGWTDSENKTYLGVMGLNDKIGTLPSGEIIPSKGLAFLLPDTDYTYPTSIGDFMEQMYDGYWGISVLAEAVYYGNEFMGQTDTTRQVKGLRQITDEIGTLPSGNFPGFPEYEEFFSSFEQPFTYPTSLAELINAIYGNSETGKTGLLSGIILGFPRDTNGDGQFDSHAGLIPNFSLAKEANDLANANATKIGTLPSGEFPEFPEYEKFFSWLKQPFTYPTSLAELINAIYGDAEFSRIGLLPGIIAGFQLDIDGDGDTDASTGLIPNFWLAKDANDLANANATKIGTLPSGSLIGNSPAMDALFGFTQNPNPPVFPNSLSDLINQLYGMPGKPSVITALLHGFNFYFSGYEGPVGILPAMELGLSATQTATTAQETATAAKTAADANTAKIGTVPDGKNLAGMISETDTKIGTLPTEYATVGAALTAMDAKIDARELPSTSDDGQYVLSAKKVGDTITYTWVRMDLTSEEQAQ